MGLMLAGQQLIVPDDDLADLVGRSLRPPRPWPARSWPGKSLTDIASPVGHTPRPPVELNAWSWGPGAGNFSESWWLASRDQADAIRDAALGDGGLGPPRPVTLAMDAPGQLSAEVLRAQVYLAMPPVPIRRVTMDDGTFDNGAYLLCCVDVRFFLWQVPCPDFQIDEYSRTWANVLDLVATTLAGLPTPVTLAYDTPDPAYRLPPKALNLKDQALPPVLDAVAASLGMKVILTYDGDLKLIGPATAQAIGEKDDGDNPARQLVGGGSFFLDNL